MIRLQFLGGGKMAEALIGGLLDSRWATVDEIAVVERYPERSDQLRKRFEGLDVVDTPYARVA
ncbi:MAG: NAD(P)-binding domain-containing protein, partial [Acidimicrobiales bacterium]